LSWLPVLRAGVPIYEEAPALSFLLVAPLPLQLHLGHPERSLENPEPAKKRLHIWKEKFKPGNWSTSANGFVFSNDEISRRLDFDKRVTAAIVLSRNGWQLPKLHRTADAGMPKAA